MSEGEYKVDVELSRRLYNLEYEAVIKRKAERRKQLEEEKKKAAEKDGEKK